jgi:hypothetical protein
MEKALASPFQTTLPSHPFLYMLEILFLEAHGVRGRGMHKISFVILPLHTDRRDKEVQSKIH